MPPSLQICTSVTSTFAAPPVCRKYKPRALIAASHLSAAGMAWRLTASSNRRKSGSTAAKPGPGAKLPEKQIALPFFKRYLPKRPFLCVEQFQTLADLQFHD